VLLHYKDTQRLKKGRRKLDFFAEKLISVIK